MRTKAFTLIAIAFLCMSASLYASKDYTKEYAMFDLDQIVVNPLGGGMSMFSAMVSLEYKQSDKNLPTELKNKKRVIEDRVGFYFSSKTVEELRKFENRETFKDEIMNTINGLLREGRITEISFSRFNIM